MSYDPLAWHDFFVMLGSAAAALTGLVFVALSLHLDRVAADPFHRFRAGVSVAGLSSVVVLSGAFLVPTQSHQAVGIEVIAISAFFVWLNATAGRHRAPVITGQSHPPTRLIYGLTTTVVYTIAGLVLFFGSGAGLLILAAAMGNSMVASIKTAWDLMIQLRHVPTGAA
jgi:modulator of FtsH protease